MPLHCKLQVTSLYSIILSPSKYNVILNECIFPGYYSFIFCQDRLLRDQTGLLWWLQKQRATFIVRLHEIIICPQQLYHKHKQRLQWLCFATNPETYYYYICWMPHFKLLHKIFSELVFVVSVVSVYLVRNASALVMVFSGMHRWKGSCSKQYHLHLLTKISFLVGLHMGCIDCNRHQQLVVLLPFSFLTEQGRIFAIDLSLQLEIHETMNLFFNLK